MPTLTQLIAAKSSWLCAFCDEPFIPKTKRHALSAHPCCSKSHGLLYRYRVLKLPLTHPPGHFHRLGTANAEKRRREQRRALAKSLGHPITKRDKAMYDLGWKHCFDKMSPKVWPRRTSA